MHPHEQPADNTTLRAEAVRRLLFLDTQQTLTHSHVRTVAETFGVHWRTVRRWMDNARTNDGIYTPAGRYRFTLTPHMHDVLAMCCGNATTAYRDLQAHPHQDDPPLPSLATFQRAVARELSPGMRAGLRGGENARRRFDVHGQRERGHRNQAWETDHVEASVWVNVEGVARKPWITWLIDCSTRAICGLAVTPQAPSRQAILAAIRDALLRGGEHSPFGGLPQLVRVDRGKDFLSSAVDQAFNAFAVEIHDLPPRRPEWKGTIEALNGAVKLMHFAKMPGYSEEPVPQGGKLHTAVEDLQHFQAFVANLLDWVTWWNTEHTLRDLDGRTPAQAWHDDLTPLYDVDPQALHTYTLESHRTPLTINSQGVRWNKAWYLDDWMHGHGGEKVQLRYTPHHYRTVELYDPVTGDHRGQAFLSNEATPQQKRTLKRGWQREADRLTRKLKKAHKNRITRYAATSRPTAPEPIDTITAQEADRQLHEVTVHREHEEPTTVPPPLTLPEPTASWGEPDPAAPRQTEDLGLDNTPEGPWLPLPEPTPSWNTTQPATDPDEKQTQ